MSTVIRHHPDSTTLLSFAAATIAEPLAAVVAAHLSMCPRCRAEVADLELLGSAIMLSVPDTSARAAMKVPARSAEVVTHVAQRVAQANERLPAPIAATYALSLDGIPWKRLGPGVWHNRLALRQEGDGDLRLLRIAPGRKMPDHGHGGAELTLVIEGSYSDVTGQYRRGDIQDVDEGVEHQPIVDKDGECVCLIASEHPARFKTLVGRLTQPWTRM
jgi:putative transcriptional regulator